MIPVITFNITVANFDLIQSGRKLLEGRRETLKAKLVRKGDLVRFICGSHTTTIYVLGVRWFKSVSEGLKAVHAAGLLGVLTPGRNLKEATAAYYSIPKYSESRFCVIGISNEPYNEDADRVASFFLDENQNQVMETSHVLVKPRWEPPHQYRTITSHGENSVQDELAQLSPLPLRILDQVNENESNPGEPQHASTPAPSVDESTLVEEARSPYSRPKLERIAKKESEDEVAGPSQPDFTSMPGLELSQEEVDAQQSLLDSYKMKQVEEARAENEAEEEEGSNKSEVSFSLFDD